MTSRGPDDIVDAAATQRRRAGLVGTGLIGGSVGMALRAGGWFVTGTDRDRSLCQRAVDVGAIDAIGVDDAAEVTFVAVPVGSVAEAARPALENGGVVTDVGSVKSPIVGAVDHPNFVGGHPMAGSEALGVDGARSDLFDGTTWVLTPTTTTSVEAYSVVNAVVRSFGADVLTLDPAQHDQLVATVSHVPHLTAATLMGLASSQAEEHSALLQLAAGGFRDMTRIAAGDPAIWLDICVDNRAAILGVLDSLLGALGSMRDVVDRADTSSLKELLLAAQSARRNLPTGAPPVEELVEVRVSIPDRPGELAAVTALATELSTNVYDIEVAHAPGERRGQLIMVVDRAAAYGFAAALTDRHRHASVHELG